MTEALTAAVRQAAKRCGLQPVSVGLAAEAGNEPVVEVDPHLRLYPASMIKTPLAAAVYALVEQGALRIDMQLDVTEANMTANDAVSPMVPGYKTTIEELIDWMLTRSDNVATNVLIDVAGRQRATRIVQEQFGLRETAFYRKLSGSLPLIADPGWDGVHLNTHPAADAARLFGSIAQRRIPFAEQLHETLARQQWNNKLSAGLREGDIFAHKTGDTDEVTHDGGIVRTAAGSTYVVVVYTGLPSSDENNAKFRDFMVFLRTLMR